MSQTSHKCTFFTMDKSRNLSIMLLPASMRVTRRKGRRGREGKKPFRNFLSPSLSPQTGVLVRDQEEQCHFIFILLKQLSKTSLPPYLCTNTKVSPVSSLLQKFWFILLLFKQSGFTLSVNMVKKSGVCRFRCMFVFVFVISLILASDNATRPAFLRKGHHIKLHLIKKNFQSYGGNGLNGWFTKYNPPTNKSIDPAYINRIKMWLW